MTKNPYDPAEFMKAFDPEAIRKMFDPQNMLAAFQQNSENLNISKLMERNKQQIDALAEANKAAAETYRDMMAKQMAIFQEIIVPAQAMIADASDPEKVRGQTDKINQAIAEGFDLMKTMAENTRKANEEALAGFKAQLDQALKTSKS